MDAVVAASWVAVAGTLGGVLVGGGMSWAREARAERRAEAGRRDELYISLMEAFLPLQVEIAGLRALLAAAEHELREVQPDTARVEAVLGELRAGIREAGPLIRELMLRAARLAMAGDEAVRQAAGGGCWPPRSRCWETARPTRRWRRSGCQRCWTRPRHWPGRGMWPPRRGGGAGGCAGRSARSLAGDARAAHIAVHPGGPGEVARVNFASLPVMAAAANEKYTARRP